MINDTKYIFVTGGVLSSLGKGISAASIALLLKKNGLKVSILKADPYINVDPGTMSPLEHGEVFVTDDGAETDLDLGHYERFLNTLLSKKNSFTAGQIYKRVIEKEREGVYLGKTIQVVPHIVNEIIEKIEKAGKDEDILIVEIGGTIGDIESLPFIEASRQMKAVLDTNRVMNIHVTLIPYITVAGEFKTKPTQHSIQELRRLGLSADLLILRTEKELNVNIKKKLSIASGVRESSIMIAKDEDTIYSVPLSLLAQDVLKPIGDYLDLDCKDMKAQEASFASWRKMLDKSNTKESITIAFIGKYLDLKESYKSLLEALSHASYKDKVNLDIKYISTDDLSEDEALVKSELADVDAILVPGGFGERGSEAKIRAIKFARENNIPFLGICLGMQLAIIEFLRNVCNIKEATSTEFNPDTKEKAIYLIDEFISQEGKIEIRTKETAFGGTMRLGGYDCHLKDNTKIREAYGTSDIRERHRHRYEANNAYRDILEKNGCIISGESHNLIETLELANHPWFVGVQFHPEFTSRFEEPNKLILSFVREARKYRANK